MGFEARADDEVSRGGEGGRVADVVEVMVGPDDGGDVGALDAKRRSVGVEDLGDVFGSGDGCGCFD